jgi:hypothetical protein
MVFRRDPWHPAGVAMRDAGRRAMIGLCRVAGVRLAAGAVALALAGCGGGIPGLSGGNTASPSGGGGSSVANLLLYGGTTVPPDQTPKDERELGCPSVGVLEGAAAYRQGRVDGSASGVAYQASLVDFARECSFEGGQLALRVGVAGRLLIGAQGRPGTFQVPVRIVVKRRSEIVTQRFTRVAVTVPANETSAEFSHVDAGIVVPVTANDPGDEYDVYVGFDPTGQQARRQTRRR